MEGKFLETLAVNCVEQLRKESETTAETAEAARKLFDRITALLSEDAPRRSAINSLNAVIEVQDKNNSRLYRRYLELGYDETENGLRLLGDDIGGNPVQIVFLSNSALEKIKDLKGSGPDAPLKYH